MDGRTETLHFDEFPNLLDLLTDATTRERYDADPRIHRIHGEALLKVIQSFLEVSGVKVGTSTSIKTENQQA